MDQNDSMDQFSYIYTNLPNYDYHELMVNIKKYRLLLWQELRGEWFLVGFREIFKIFLDTEYGMLYFKIIRG